MCKITVICLLLHIVTNASRRLTMTLAHHLEDFAGEALNTNTRQMCTTFLPMQQSTE